jgi:N-acetylmuramoyl-L-alanine amidase
VHGHPGQQDDRHHRVPGDEAGQGSDDGETDQGDSGAVEGSEHDPSVSAAPRSAVRCEILFALTWPTMRSLLLALLVLVGACTSSLADEVTGGEVSNTSSTLSVVETTTTPESTMTTLRLESITTEKSEALGLVTATGVVVAVSQETPDGYLVVTPCGNEQVVAGGTPIGPVGVVIDPGHGGEVDTGAVGANGLMGKDLNLVVAQSVEAKLIVRGIPVILTRTADYASRLGVRTGLADRLQADLLLSVHHNAPTPGPSQRPGTEVFIQHESAESRRLGGLVWTHVVAALAPFRVDWSAAPDAGVLSVLSSRGNDAYGINRNAETVSVLAELGYLSNPPEAELFATSEYVEKAAQALVDAIEDYLGTDAPGAGFVAEPRIFNPQPGIGAGACVDPVLE